jgi:hypothetical protein
MAEEIKNEKKESKVSGSIRKAKGFVTVKFLKELGSNEVGIESQMHRSTAMALAQSGIVKIVSEVKVYKPKKVKE